MKEYMLIIIPVILAESIALLVAFFKTFPVMQSKMELLEKNEEHNEKAFADLKKVVELQTIQHAEANKDHERLKSDLGDTRTILKENNTELRKSLEDNTKAIIALETTLKVLGSSLVPNRPL